MREANPLGRRSRLFSRTDARGQVGAVADVREAEHLLPLPAATFDPSICRRRRGKALACVTDTQFHHREARLSLTDAARQQLAKKRVQRDASTRTPAAAAAAEERRRADTPAVKRRCTGRARRRALPNQLSCFSSSCPYTIASTLHYSE